MTVEKAQSKVPCKSTDRNLPVELAEMSSRLAHKAAKEEQEGNEQTADFLNEIAVGVNQISQSLAAGAITQGEAKDSVEDLISDAMCIRLLQNNDAQ